MDTNKKTARIVEVLFIIGTAAGVLCLPAAASIVHAPDYLVKLSENKNSVILGAFLTLIMGISLSMFPVILFPIFKKYNEAFSLLLLYTLSIVLNFIKGFVNNYGYET